MATKHGLKVILEFGNSWDLYGMSAKSFSKVASTAASRTEFVTQLLTLVDDHQFDGLSLRWEKPGCPGVSRLPFFISIDVI
jgi:GH18 family chitinase